MVRALIQISPEGLLFKFHPNDFSESPMTVTPRVCYVKNIIESGVFYRPCPDLFAKLKYAMLGVRDEIGNTQIA